VLEGALKTRVRSVHAGDQALRAGGVGRVRRKGLAQDLLLVAHALQLEGEVGDDEKRGPERCVLEKQP
jgi:hypothetical protein